MSLRSVEASHYVWLSGILSGLVVPDPLMNGFIGSLRGLPRPRQTIRNTASSFCVKTTSLVFSSAIKIAFKSHFDWLIRYGLSKIGAPNCQGPLYPGQIKEAWSFKLLVYQ